MPPEARDRLRHMRDAARQAIEASHGLDRRDLERDSLTTLGLIKLIEIIGEAARHVPEPVQRELPELDWPAIVAMRNNLVHGYFNIDFTIVEQTLRHDLPPMLEAVERYLDQRGEAG